MLLGGLLPWVDVLWEDVLGNKKEISGSRSNEQEPLPASSSSNEDKNPGSRPGSGKGADWNPVVRSVGAFVGIAFAIVRALMHDQ